MENKFMQIAFDMAKEACEKGEVPVGAAILRGDELISMAHNETIEKNNPCAHAEMLAIERAFEKTGAYRLDDCEMYVTLEPCPMCAGAIALARLKRVYFGAYDAEKGAFGGKIDIAPDMNIKTEIYGGIEENESKKILKNFFRKSIDK